MKILAGIGWVGAADDFFMAPTDDAPFPSIPFLFPISPFSTRKKTFFKKSE
jgi:hypothetical protein